MPSNFRENKETVMNRDRKDCLSEIQRILESDYGRFGGLMMLCKRKNFTRYFEIQNDL